ncbi:site-specific DNA-methyltransferase [Canibacter sp. lx-45]|uniref:site-specific DNA-methyltransferase n=1 Tax=Canibacter zhuwentaonis TaxID=2837491 RepID=UPI001BDC8639|nr:site-specific DNA-methyltransferase [Canibacter zhuwentaonis]MBT1035492.1 site-specific DNA-methyltransferase [Canibacter zhuwentaonis]
MIRDAREHNEAVTPNEFKLERLCAALPEYFDKNGAFMLDRFQESLKEGDVSITKEGYELKFLGKSYAKYLTSTETETVVVPDLEHNNQPQNKESENLYIVGDNLDALKHLLGSYAGKVKCIYIDPPYNTGSDGFVYNDDFGFTPAQLVDKIGLSEDEAARVLDLQGKSSHSAWLTFLYPRLQLAKELLLDDGVIFISIDDNEQANLRLLCDEVFGEQNYVACAPRKTGAGSAASRSEAVLRKLNDYVLIYTRGEGASLSRLVKGKKVYPYRDDHGDYRLGQFHASGSDATRVARPNMWYPIFVTPDGTLSLEKSDNAVEVVPPLSNGMEGRWLWRPEKFNSEASRYLVFDGSKIQRKIYLNPVEDQTEYQVDRAWFDEYTNAAGSKEFDSLFDRKKIFDHPKSTALLRRLFNLIDKPGAVILDFFSGSASSAEAVLRMNAHDQGNRKFIMVQLPELVEKGKPASQAGYRTIDEIGRERIKRAAAKIKDETGADIDYGFKLYRLEEPSGRVLEDLEKFNPNDADALFTGDYVEKFSLRGTPGHDTVLATWLVKDGYGLTILAERVKLAGYELDVCGDSGYVINTGLTSDDVVKLVQMLETGELGLSRVVVFGYSVEFSVMHELKKNLAVLKSGKTVDVIERF